MVYQRIFQMPKVELHVHLDGSIRPETILALAVKEGVDLPTTDLDELRRYLEVPKECESLGAYLARFEFPLAVTQTYEALERAAYELCEDEARENVRYFEVRFAPQSHTRKGMTPDRVVQAVLDGLNEGQIEFNIKAGLILCAVRHQPLAENLAIAELAGRFKEKGVVAVDLAGDEAHFPVEEHAAVFRRAKELGLHITIHAGEAAGAESIANAIAQGAERIGHGVTAIRNPEVLRMVKERGILLETCPTSNLHTGAIAALADHPLKIYYDLGMKVSISTDNRTTSHTTLTDEYLLVMEQLGFTADDLCRMNLYAAEAAFLPDHEKSELIKEIRKG